MRNHSAKQNLMKMKKGDRAFFYHSNDGKDIVGVVEIVREHYPDPTEQARKFVVVDCQGARADAEAGDARRHQTGTGSKDMVLINNSRLSVQPVTAEEWKTVCRLGGMKA